MTFADRLEQLKELGRTLLGSRPGLVRVYGRRRLGKTEPLRKPCREHGGLYRNASTAAMPP